MVEEVRARVAKLLEELDGVLALKGAAGDGAPYLFKKGEDLSPLVLSPHYGLALTVARIQKAHPQARLGAAVRACDLRALVELAKRKLVDPERLYLLGMACTPVEAEECQCAQPTPNLSAWPQGEMVGAPTEGIAPGAIPQDQRAVPGAKPTWEFWKRQFLQCMKCYGCRNICSLCHCEACALEDPLWVEPGELAPPFPAFHLIRAMHMAGRCIDCGECERACPAEIPLRELYRKLARDVEELFGYRSGRSIEEALPVLLTLEK